MKTFYRTLGAVILLALINIGVTSSVLAQRQYRDSDATIRSLLQRIETRSDNLRLSIDNALDRSRIDGTNREDEINRLVRDFENAADQLKQRFENRRSTAADVQAVLDRAALINRFILNNRLGFRAEQDWRLLQSDLDQLARSYYITDWRWTTVGGIDTGVGSRVSLTQAQLRQLARRIENRANRVSISLTPELNRLRINTSERNETRRHLNMLETATAQLRNRVNSRNASASDAQEVLDHAVYIDRFVANNQLSNRAESDWNLLKTDLSELASAYNVAWNWDNVPGGPVYGSEGELTGTYRLNMSQSASARQQAEAATRNLPAGQRQRVYDSLLRRLDPPDVLAIEQRGTNVTIASSRAPQINFVADGREHVETTPNGRTVRVRANLSGDQLTIMRTGERAQDFTVTFDPTDNGRRLTVSRTLYSDQLSQPVSVTSYYDRTSDVAQLDIYRGGQDIPNTGEVAADFIIPNGTQLTTSLNSSLSTETSREGDRFTMRVLSPEQYAGATIEGHVASVNRSGRVTGRSEMNLAFDSIRMPDGRTYRFAGILETVRVGNETVRVDNEGAVREDDQTGRTVTRTAIGTAVGAIIGAIAGGGKGAAIGAVIGAGAGAGSVYVQGREDLDLPVGAEIVVRATGPR